MRWTLERITDPEFEPVELAEMKTRLGEHADLTGRDDDIEESIKSAREWVEDYTGRILVDQTWRLTLSSYIGTATVPTGRYFGEYRPSATGEILLRKSPVLAIVSLSTFDATGAETDEDDALFELRGADTKWPTLFPLTGASWGSGEARILFRAGYADTTSSSEDDATVIPARFKQAIKLHVEAHYDRNPDTMKLLLEAAKALIKPERCDLSIA